MFHICNCICFSKRHQLVFIQICSCLKLYICIRHKSSECLEYPLKSSDFTDILTDFSKSDKSAIFKSKLSKLFTFFVIPIVIVNFNLSPWILCTSQMFWLQEWRGESHSNLILKLYFVFKAIVSIVNRIYF